MPTLPMQALFNELERNKQDALVSIDACPEAVGGIRVNSVAGYKYLEDPPTFFQLYKERIKRR